MDAEVWRNVLVGVLGFNAVIGFGYRVYRLSLGGPIADVWGQAILGVFLTTLALALAFGVTWLRWVALVYAAVFGLIAMPVWVLGVLLPLKPRALDYSFTLAYWVGLLVIAVAALAS